LTINFRLKFFRWKTGLCVHSPIEKQYQQIIQIIAGPIFPLLFAYLFYELSLRSLNDYFITAAIFLILLTSISLAYNLIPNSKPIPLTDGSSGYNDGYTLLLMYQYRNSNKEYNQAIEYYLRKDYASASEILVQLVDERPKSKIVHKLAIFSSIQVKKQEILPLINNYLENFIPDYDDLINIGYYYSQVGNNAAAQTFYEKALEKKENWLVLNNIGYSLLTAERYEEALAYLNRAVALGPEHAYGYNNRGLVKIKLGHIDEGLQDLETGHKLDPLNAYYFKNMGTYYFGKKEYCKALELFEKAKQMDADTYKIESDIEMTKANLTI
jgi:tetratricopeptide (TPR) repeat protein